MLQCDKNFLEMISKRYHFNSLEDCEVYLKQTKKPLNRKTTMAKYARDFFLKHKPNYFGFKCIQKYTS